MQRGSNRRLINLKTKAESGFDYVLSCLEIETPFGKKTLKDSPTFYPGDEEALREELDKLDLVKAFTEKEKKKLALLSEQFMCMKDITTTLERSRDFCLSVVEIFEVKSLLIYTEEIRRILNEETLPSEFIPEEIDDLKKILDPRGDGTNTFYLYDEYSERLASLRKEKKVIDLDIRKIQKARKDLILKEHGINLTPKFDIVIPKSSKDLEKARTIAELEAVQEDYQSITFALTKGEEAFVLIQRGEELEAEIEEEENKVRERLSLEIAERSGIILDNCNRLGRLDFVLSKAKLASKRGCVKPEIVDEHIISIKGGRHLQVEEVLKSKGKEYTPISITLEEGVTCITGANMGGKTISLKLAALTPILAQNGFFVPAEEAKIGLSNFIRILIGDSQSVERGLSSFGSEMEELKEIMDQAQERSLILVDEIASGTNPVEGLALTKSLVEYFMKKPYITLLTTHYEGVTEEDGVKNMQVRGLKGADFSLLDRELKLANRKQRIDIIGKYMDYRLEEVQGDGQVPKDALNIAKMLGISNDIIEGAKKYIKAK